MLTSTMKREDNMPTTITAENILALTKHARSRIISGVVDNQQSIVAGGINTPLRLCHFMAQLAHESAHFQVTLEFASGKAYGAAKTSATHERETVRATAGVG